MADERLEEKLWNLKDWIPGYGALHLFKRLDKMPYNLKEAFKTDCYILANGLYNESLFIGLSILYTKLQ